MSAVGLFHAIRRQKKSNPSPGIRSVRATHTHVVTESAKTTPFSGAERKEPAASTRRSSVGSRVPLKRFSTAGIAVAPCRWRRTHATGANFRFTFLLFFKYTKYTNGRTAASTVTVVRRCRVGTIRGSHDYRVRRFDWNLIIHTVARR